MSYQFFSIVTCFDYILVQQVFEVKVVNKILINGRYFMVFLINFRFDSVERKVEVYSTRQR